jgi:hypothetical protein
LPLASVMLATLPAGLGRAQQECPGICGHECPSGEHCVGAQISWPPPLPPAPFRPRCVVGGHCVKNPPPPPNNSRAQDCTNNPTCNPSPPTATGTCTYDAPAITNIAANGGAIWIRVVCIPPNPTRCGESNQWVRIPSDSDESMKALAISLYLSGRPVRIDTKGCSDTWEKVDSLYSPGN